MQVDWHEIRHLAELYMESSSNSLRPSRLSDWFGVLDGGEFVAFAHTFWRSPDVISLNACFVLPEHRGRGYYDLLLDERLLAAMRQGAKKAICGFDHDWMGEHLVRRGFTLVEYAPGKHHAERAI